MYVGCCGWSSGGLYIILAFSLGETLVAALVEPIQPWAAAPVKPVLPLPPALVEPVLGAFAPAPVKPVLGRLAEGKSR